MIERILPNSEATVELGEIFSRRVVDRAVVALSGPLGAGKTTFVQGVARGLGIKEVVNSPTFTMLNEYHSGRLPLYHLDLYRLSDASSKEESRSLKLLIATEMDEFLQSRMICVIEWAELFHFLEEEEQSFIDELDHLKIELSYLTENGSTAPGEEDKRKVSISSFGVNSDLLYESLKSSLATIAW